MQSSKLKFYLIHFIVVLITLACLLMNTQMRGGLPIDTSASERMLFISNHTAIWSISWCIWMFCALGLFTFCTILADELKRDFLRTVGLFLVALGIAPDLTAEVIYAFVIPKTLQLGYGIETFQLLETIAAHLTGFLGNGLYNLGGMLLTLLAIQQRIIKPWVSIWGMISWTLGILLSVSIALDSMQGAEFFTVSSMVLSTTWMIIFAYTVIGNQWNTAS